MDKVKKIWTEAEVEKYVKQMLNYLEISLSEQKDSFVELKNKYDKLSKDYSLLKSKEKKLSLALTDSNQKIKDETESSAMALSLEIEKVKQFSFRWVTQFEELAKNYPDYLGQTIKTEFEEEIESLIDEIEECHRFKKTSEEKQIKKPISITPTKTEWFQTESKRIKSSADEISKDEEKRYNNIIKKIKNEMIFSSELSKPSESGFDIDEAMNPKDSLGEILNDILK